MKGDIVNGISFGVIVPWYYFLAFRNLWVSYYSNNDNNTNENSITRRTTIVNDNGDESIDLSALFNNNNNNNNNFGNSMNGGSSDLVILDTTQDEAATLTTIVVLPPEPPVEIQFLLCILFTITIACSFLSWKHNCVRRSTIAFIFSWIATAFMNIIQWPHAGETIMFPQFLWHLLIITTNSLPFYYRVVFSLFSMIMAWIIVAYTPLYSVEETWPILFGATAVHILLHISLASDTANFFSLKNDTFRSLMARYILAAVFAYHVLNEIIHMLGQPGYAIIGGFSILRAGFFASFGLFAAGAFKTESDANDRLGILVHERTQQIQKQANRLRMVEMALEASETAIAITDKHLNIVWYNPALKRLCLGDSNVGNQKECKTSNDLTNVCILDVLQISKSDCEKVIHCFNDQTSMEAEIEVNTATIQIQVGPFPDDSNESSHSIGSTNHVTTSSSIQTTGSASTGTPSNNNTSTTNGNVPNSSSNRFVVVLKDFTERRKRQLAEKAAEREALLKHAMAESCQILSHELRTPLQGIMGITSMLLDGHEFTKDTEDALSLVMVSSRLLLTLINNMLDVRKCDAAMMGEFELVETELLPPLEDAINFCRPLGAMSGVPIDLQPISRKASDVIVLSDPLRLQQVVINLVSNAIKHSTAGKNITIRARFATLEEAEYEISTSLESGPTQTAWDEQYKNNKSAMNVVIVSVCDTGSGIDVKQAHRLFQKFSQLNDHCSTSLGGNEVGQPSGTGLGLNLCLKFVQRMKGNIWAGNNTGDQTGAFFSFYLPLVSNTNVDIGVLKSNGTNSNSCRDSPKVQQHTLTSSVAEHCRILVVDDTFINLKVLDRMLRRIGVTNVKCVESGPLALSALENDSYNLVITDIQMPGMSGLELSERIRSSNNISPIPPVVGLTAEVSKSMDEKCAKSGIISVIHKPMTVNELKDFFDQVVSQLIIVQ